MKNITDQYSHKGINFKLTWIPGEYYDKYSPITQVYGFCFDNKNRLLTIKNNYWKCFMVPGGSPENNETPIETLVRELDEEVNITVKDINYLGVQKVEGDNKIRYQLRFACRIDKLNSRKTDPCDGIIHRRYFVDPLKYGELSLWGEIGDAITQSAMEKLKIKS